MKVNQGKSLVNCTNHSFTQGRWGAALLSLLLLLVVAWQPSANGAATITTDQPDYPAFSDVVITGAGFAAGEVVDVKIDQIVEGADPVTVWVASPAPVADSTGAFQVKWYIWSADFVGATLQATATGPVSGTVTTIFTDGTPLPGVVPTTEPPTHFGIDGDLYSGVPTPDFVVGDWFPGVGRTDGVFSGVDPVTKVGIPNYPLTYHLTDPWGDRADNNFAGGNKVNTNPNAWTWVSNPVGDKQDINNALIHFTTDDGTVFSDHAGHLWVIMAADRLSDNGAAYIDFEFLQSKLEVTTTPGSSPPSGGFVSSGPDGGRTVGDILLTLTLTKGGKAAGFFVERWQTDPKTGGYNYVDQPVDLDHTVTAVNTQVVTTPYPAFGVNQYQVNTFAEGAIDLSDLLGKVGELGPCKSLGIQTVLVKTKESQSPTATIVDFISPLQLGVTVGLDCTIKGAPAILPGETYPVIYTGTTGLHLYNDSVGSFTYAWSIVGNPSYVHITPNPATTDTIDISVDANAPSETFTVSLTMKDIYGCEKTCTQTFEIKPFTQPETRFVCADQLGVEYVLDTYPANWESIKWWIEADNTPAAAFSSDMVVDADGFVNDVLSVKVDAGGAVSGAVAYTVHVEVTYPGGTVATSWGTYVDPLDPCLISGPPEPLCPNLIDNLYSVATMAGDPYPEGTTYAWSITGNGDIPGAKDGSSVSVTAGAGCDADFVLSVTVTYPSGCHTTCTKTVRVKDIAPPSITCPPPVTGSCADDVPAAATDKAGFVLQGGTIADDNCGGAVTVTSRDETTPGSCVNRFTILRTYSVKDVCGNEATCTQTITINDTQNPSISCPTIAAVQCVGDVPAAYANLAAFLAAGGTATDNCDTALTFSKTSDSGLVGSCPGTVTRVYRVTDACGNFDECTQVITVDDTVPPVIDKASCPANIVVCEGTTVSLSGPSATDNCTAPAALIWTYTRSDLEDTETHELIEFSTLDALAASLTDPDTLPVVGVTVTITATVTDGCGNWDRCFWTLTITECEKHCSFTQGYWGKNANKENSKAPNRIALIESLLVDADGKDNPIVIGVKGRSLTIHSGEGDCISKRLPAGGPSIVLPADDNEDSVCWSGFLLLDNQGKLRNNLLGQTIALELNVRYDALQPPMSTLDTPVALADFSIATSFTIWSSGSETELVLGKDCHTYTVSKSVLDALDYFKLPKTVGGLLDLASLGLGGAVGPDSQFAKDGMVLSLGDIATAVTMINEAFDECRIWAQSGGCPK